MDSDAGNHTLDEQVELAQHLRQFLLVSRSEAGAELVDKLVRIHAQGAGSRHYRLTGELGFFSSLVSALLARWGHRVYVVKHSGQTATRS